MSEGMGNSRADPNDRQTGHVTESTVETRDRQCAADDI